MKLYLPLALVLFTCFAFTAKAQSFSIKGTVSDTVNSNPLENASVTLMRAADSILETYTRVNSEGAFLLTPSKEGKYILMVTFPGFADYVDVLNVKDEQPLDLGAIPMVTKTHLLKEFVLTQQVSAIKIKGDTTEYVADSFKVRDNATVESLLKKLPGIQVGKDGQIVAQGEKVEKILVDGEEFFSDDPAVVTKSLQANVVDKVQVFDKKSDQAEFTGIDDGEKTKTINLQLKENKKKGYFGKAVAGGGAGDDQSYFENQAMVNGFKGKRKLSAFGIMANTGTVGLGWEDKEKFTGGANAEMNEDGFMYTSYDEDDDQTGWDGKYNGEGLPKAWTGGLHYSNKWNEDKHRLSSNYRYANQLTETTGNMLTQYVLPGDSQYFSQQNRDLYTSGQRNRIDGLYEWKIDSTSTLKITANAGHTHTQNRSVYHTETFTGEGSGINILNYNDRTLTTDATTQSINSTLDWRKKFKKKGRTISLSLTESYKETESEGYLLAQNSTGVGNVDQRKNNHNNTLSLSGRVSYTEPLSKVMFIELNYSAKTDNNSADRDAYNKTAPQSDGYNNLDSTFSSNYAFNVFTNTGGSNLRFVYEKLNFSFGGSVANAAFQQDDLMADTSVKYNFTNFFPRANIAYNMSKRSKVSLNYNGSTNQPTLQQIQPLRDNTDPMNIAIGNPNITQEFNHRINLQINDYRPMSGRYLWLGSGISFVNNDISRAENIDAIGRRVYQYINVDGNYSLWGNLWYGYRIAKLNVQTGVSINVNANHVNNYVNDVKNTSDYNAYTFRFDINYDSKDEKISFRLNPGITYNDNKSTISTLATSFWTSDNEAEASFELPLKFEVGTSVNWYIRQKTSIFDANNNVFKWNAYVSKKFLKNDQLELRAFVNDILNQNIGFNRYAQNNFITENNYNTIRRYGMLSLIWNFTRSGMGEASETPSTN